MQMVYSKLFQHRPTFELLELQLSGRRDVQRQVSASKYLSTHIGSRAHFRMWRLESPSDSVLPKFTELPGHIRYSRN
jgi:hypothetical protein